MSLLRHLPSGLNLIKLNTFYAFVVVSPIPFRNIPHPAHLCRRQQHLRHVRTFNTTQTLSATLAPPSPSPSPAASDDSSGTSDVFSTAALQREVKRHVAQKAVRKLITAVQAAEAGEGDFGAANIQPSADIYRIAIRGLVSAARPDLAVELYQTRIEARRARPLELYADLPLASAVLRSLCRNSSKRNLMREGLSVVSDDMLREVVQLQKLAQTSGDSNEVNDGKKSNDGSDTGNSTIPVFDAVLPRQASALMTAAGALFGGADRDIPIVDAKLGLKFVEALKMFSKELGARVGAPVEDYNALIRVLGKRRQLPSVFDVVEAMDEARVEKNNETFEFLANAALRQVKFITGAVSMETLPKDGLEEVAFIGRSNVGKSSLVNMLCNRRALAYVSGRPGKTQQFNYFLVNELDRENQFFLVDLPGVGFAKVPKEVKAEWLKFMSKYFRRRDTLRLVFHLVDGRHGALSDDEELMHEMSKLPGVFRYVVVLTKMDKLDKQKVKRSVLDKTRIALRQNGCSDNVPIIATSATTRLGRDELWWHLLHALKPGSMADPMK